jgi:hypothetical protein
MDAMTDARRRVRVECGYTEKSSYTREGRTVYPNVKCVKCVRRLPLKAVSIFSVRFNITAMLT